MEDFIFDKNDYDLEGFLGKSEMAMADFVFMIYEEATETYYMDRMEVRKYDSNFNKFVQRVRAYLEKDETHALFVLFAAMHNGSVTLYDGSGSVLEDIQAGDIDLEEEGFYGVLIQVEEEELVFHQAFYINAKYEGDARAAIIHNGGILTDIAQKNILEFR